MQSSTPAAAHPYEDDDSEYLMPGAWIEQTPALPASPGSVAPPPLDGIAPGEYYFSPLHLLVLMIVHRHKSLR